ncbi:STAS domain-containing protein [Blastopirellula sp. JC732]|uniref:STAS domain-containing protein n=1 Tax=Blastopirellula sediminis TaxID=2894196 RepID=A0A9X1SMA5_9BACT|nr:STAS domain-containing protein [Blastopirellula sediminis]MCC9605216.1 STAS domain-containing protein [Blastopirellula sediminis]MCC9631484.1 STAS domain-containing protein [Blastopirellula sediminis]
MELHVVSHEGEIVQVSVSGRVSQDGSMRETEPLSALIGIDAYRRTVLLNMQEADIIDSSGVGWLLACHKNFQESGGKLVIYNMPPIVANVFKLMRLDTFFQIVPNGDAAMRLAKG